MTIINGIIIADSYPPIVNFGFLILLLLWIILGIWLILEKVFRK